MSGAAARMFDKLKKLKQMRDQALAIQRQLAEEEVVVEEDNVKVVMTGDQKMKSLKIDGEENERVLRVINQAIKEAQKIAARKVTQMGGGLSDFLK